MNSQQKMPPYRQILKLFGARSRRWQLLLVLAASAIGAALSGAQPTGDPRIDQVLVPAFGAAVAAMGVRATKWVLLPLSVLPAVVMFPSLLATFPLALTLVTVFGLSRGGRNRRLSAGVIAGASVQVLLRMPPIGFFGLPSLVALAALTPLATESGRRLLRSWVRSRTSVVAPAGFAAAVLVIGMSVLWLTVQRLQADVNAGFASARTAGAAASSGDQERMLDSIEASRLAFARADDRLRSPAVKVARLLPVLSQQFRAADVAIEQALLVSGTAEEAVKANDINSLYSAERWIAFDRLGRTEAALEAMSAAVSDADRALQAVDTAWLLPGLHEALDESLIGLGAASEDLNLARDALDVVPVLLGAEEEQRVLVLLTTPAETRELGGFVGAYALLSAASDGLVIEASGPIGDLASQTAPITDPAPFSDWYLRYDLSRYPQNLTGTLDMRTVLAATQQVFPELEGRPVDLVAYVDPEGVSAFVEILGSVSLPDSQRRLNSRQMTEFLLRGQYFEWPDPLEQNDLLSELLHQVFSDFISEGLPSPGAMARVFGPRIEGGHLSLVASDAEANAFLEAVGLLHKAPGSGDGDVLGVVQVNAAPSKLDAYIQRTVTYAVELDPATGRLDGTVTVKLESEAPNQLPLSASGEVGSGGATGHRILLSVFTPHDVVDVSIDGWPVDSARFDEYGLNRTMVQVPVDRGGVATVRFTVSGGLPTGDYKLSVLQQPMANPDLFSVDVQAVSGWRLEPEASNPAAVDVELRSDLQFDYDARATSEASRAVGLG